MDINMDTNINTDIDSEIDMDNDPISVEYIYGDESNTFLKF